MIDPGKTNVLITNQGLYMRPIIRLIIFATTIISIQSYAQNSPRRVEISKDQNGCPAVFVHTQKPGNNQYNDQFPWTVIDYQGSTIKNGRKKEHRSQVAVLIGGLSQSNISLGGLMNITDEGFRCGRDGWNARVIQWRDSTGPV